MEIIRRNRPIRKADDGRITARTLVETEEPKAGEGRLVLGLHDKNHITIAGVRIYLHAIQRASGNNRTVRLQFVGPVNVPITRSDRGND